MFLSFLLGVRVMFYRHTTWFNKDHDDNDAEDDVLVISVKNNKMAIYIKPVLQIHKGLGLRAEVRKRFSGNIKGQKEKELASLLQSQTSIHPLVINWHS